MKLVILMMIINNKELEMEENDGRDSNSSEERLTYTSYENDINADNAREIENMLNK